MARELGGRVVRRTIDGRALSSRGHSMTWSLDELAQVGVQKYKQGWIFETNHPTHDWVIGSNEDLRKYNQVESVFYAFCASWAQCGFPTVKPELQAVRAYTQQDPVEDVAGPWPCWAIALPSEQTSVQFVGQTQQPESVTVIMCAYGRGKWSYVAIGDTCQYVELGNDLAYLLSGRPEFDNDWIPKDWALDVSSQDMSSGARAARLMVNTTHALFQLEGVERKGKERPARIRGRLPAGDYYLTVPGPSPGG